MKRQQAQPAPASHNQSFEHLSDEDLLSLLDDSVDTHSEDSWQSQFQQMQQRMHQYEVANATQSLEREISQATSKYPVVPREALLQAVINDDSANLMEVAEQYSSLLHRSKKLLSRSTWLRENLFPRPPRTQRKRSRKRLLPVLVERHQLL